MRNYSWVSAQGQLTNNLMCLSLSANVKKMVVQAIAQRGRGERGGWEGPTESVLKAKQNASES